MKMKKLCSGGLAMLLALVLALPTFASEVPEGSEEMEQEPIPEIVQVPEEIPEPEELPDLDLTPIPDETTEPDSGTVEPEISPMPEEAPPSDETPPPEVPPETDAPQEPSDEIIPDESPEDSELPEPVPSVQSDSEEAVTQEETALIEVVVPETGRIIINPYGFPIDTEDGVSSEQIINSPQVITNLSTVPVTVWATAVGNISELSDIVYVTEPPQEVTPEKGIFLYTEFQQADGESWLGSYMDAPNQILVTDQLSEPKAVLTLEARDSAQSFGRFRLFGAVTKFPDQDWCTDDEIKVTIAFTFTEIPTEQPPIQPDDIEENAEEETVPEEDPGELLEP